MARKPTEKISPQEFQRLVSTCQVLEKDAHGEKVLRRDDDIIIKIFRRKRFFSSALLYPYARRFAHNAVKLRTLGIPTVVIEKMGHCRQPQRDLIWYQPVPGETLRATLAGGEGLAWIPELATFVARLHHHGILFRSLHFGNIIVQENGTLGLIDVADLRFCRRPLSVSARKRNFIHLTRYREDRAALHAGLKPFIDTYLAASGMVDHEQKQLSDWLHDYSREQGRGAQ